MLYKKNEQMQSEIDEDLIHSQIIIVIARWILVVLGLMLTLWDPGSIGELRIQVLILLILAGANFYLHAQILIQKPIAVEMAYAASIADIVAITLFIIVGGGFSSNVYTFYFPAVLASSVVFPTKLTRTSTLVAVGFYSVVSIVGTGFESTSDNLSLLVTRLLMIIAIAFCGNLYWRIERQRRTELMESREVLAAEIKKRSVSFIDSE